MKNAEKMNKVAGANEKVLPGNVISLAEEKNLPVRGVAAAALAKDQKSEIINLDLVAGPAADPAAPTAGTLATSSVINLPARALDRTHDMVALQVTRLQDAGLDSLHVVIKPGAGTQLSLELRQHGDTVDAQAVLQRGDFNYLNQHWPELQQRLEQRGVKLAPLAGQENATAGNGQNGFQQPSQQQSAESDPLFASAFAEFALAGAARTSGSSAATTATTTPRGWETWA